MKERILELRSLKLGGIGPSDLIQACQKMWSRRDFQTKGAGGDSRV